MEPTVDPVRIGLLGVGHLGKIHLRLLQESPDFELVGFFDTDPLRAAEVAAASGVPAFGSASELMAAVEAVDVVTPTSTHFSLAAEALRQGKHVFIEKPITESNADAEALAQLLAARPGLIGQVGHVERFNPALLALTRHPLQPLFIEGHRLAFYNPRGVDVSVVHDLMIHDLDVVLSLVRSTVRSVQASGVAVVSETPDIANARIEFENGCIANLTASRISLKNMRRLRFFQKNAYVSVDFLEKKTEVIRLADASEPNLPPSRMEWDTGENKRFVVFEPVAVTPNNAIAVELAEFAASVRTGAAVRVSFQDGLAALRLANTIRDEIDRHTHRVSMS